MRLTEAQSRALLGTHSAHVTEACDGCGKILGPVRYTSREEKGEWCSQLCRDGVERKAGVCRNCSTLLNGKRKGSIYCDRTCRMRAVRKASKDLQIIVNTPIGKQGLTKCQKAGQGDTFRNRGEPFKSRLMQ
jgi:hypothetical protein